ncbi:MAG: BatA domain-containing protein [Planctomycetes bacterium]|jgi:hypothetical protein|nr:BatA domain-containing protein [Planctomycetota bacterium]
MSLLYPLFLAGIAAVSLPILLHMIRRHTRKRVTFSSLMFLRPTLPRFRSRSRLEHVPLLILRCLVLCLLAFAFARPFLARPAASGAAAPSQRTVLLIDTSASMRRTGMWDRVLDEARSVLRDTGPADRLCVMRFDRGARTVIGFEQWETMNPAQRASLVTQELSRVSPGWGGTDLGQALITAAEAIEDDETNDAGQARAARQVVLVSDLQQGSRLEALRAYEWPQGLQLVVRTIPSQGATNAALQLVTKRDSLAPAQAQELPEIRVTNSGEAARDHFELRWAGGDATSETASPPLDVYVAAGHSTVVPAPARPQRQNAVRLVLAGDEDDFDNVLYVLPNLAQQVNVLYVGSDDPNDTAGMLYYLRQAFGTGQALTSHIVHRPASGVLDAQDIDTAHLIVVTDALDQRNIAPLRRYLEAGQSLLLALKSADAGAALSALAGAGPSESQEAEVDLYAMLGRLEFDHPLLKPFSDPRFGDFTRIHFWKYRRIEAADYPGARVLARYENDDPAWLEIPVGKGALLVWTSGWQPSDSDLALSSKFVPLLYGTLEYGGTLPSRQSQYFIGDAVPLPTRAFSQAAGLQVRKPDGAIVRVGAGGQAFTETDLPGVYSIADLGSPGGIVKPEGLGDGRVAGVPPALRGHDARDRSSGDAAPRNLPSFAVNLPVAESRTDPLPVEELEKLGVLLKPTAGAVSAAAQRAAHHRSFSEMESRQKLWRWVLAATFVVLLIETWLGGWLTRPSPMPEGDQP